jgi:hypothetical protein
MVVRHGAWKENLDAEAQSSVGKAVDEGVVGLLVGAQQELPLRTAACDHVEPTWNDLAWHRQSAPPFAHRMSGLVEVLRARTWPFLTWRDHIA